MPDGYHAKLAKIAGLELPGNAAPDSYDFSAVWKGEPYATPFREATVHNTSKNVWGIRKGDWLFINNSSGSGPRTAPKSFMKLRGYSEFETEYLVFNMREDPEQRHNLYPGSPEIAEELKGLLARYREQDYSVSRWVWKHHWTK